MASQLNLPNVESTKEELMLFFFKLSLKIKEERTLLKSFYKVNFTLIPKPGKDTTGETVIGQYPYKHSCKISQQNPSNLNSTAH